MQQSIEAATCPCRHSSCSNTPRAARVSASVAILDRAFGRPAQAVQHVGDDDESVKKISNIKAVRRIAFLFESAIQDASERGIAIGQNARIHTLQKG